MSRIDIRGDCEVSVIAFANQTGGGHRCVELKKNVPVQFDIVALNGTYLHIRQCDVDNLILALEKAKELWGE